MEIKERNRKKQEGKWGNLKIRTLDRERGKIKSLTENKKQRMDFK